MRNSRSFLLKSALFLLLLSVSSATAIAQVTATVAVMPPYSPDIEQYADNTRITVVAFDYGDIECSLRLTITGDNGVELVSLIDFMFQTFSLQNGVPVILSGPDLSEYFDLNHLIVSGIDPAELASQGLPPGNYRICARVYSGGRPLSEDVPSGCSNFLRVNYLQPPMLISPADGSEVENTLAQQIIFSWTPSPGAPVWTSYVLKIVEISDPGRDPDEAMLSATTPPFFEEEVNGTSFLYGPAQPLLDPGKRYAFQVIATDLETHSRFENFGRSEVYSFRFGKESDNILAFPEVTEKVGAVSVKPVKAAGSWTIPNTFVGGTMQYLFPQDQGTRGFMKNIPLKLRVGYYILSGNNQKTYLGGRISDYYIKAPQYVEAHGYTFAFQGILQTDTLPEITENIAFCTTGDNGEFVFMFNNPGLGLVAENVVAQRTQIGLEFGGMKGGEPVYVPNETIEVTTGDLYMYANIIVDNPYYTSPVKEVLTHRGEHADLGVVTTNVRSYDLKVNVRADKSYQDQYKQDNVESMVVYLLRGYQPGGVPANEGKGSQPVEVGEKMFNMSVIAKEITGNTGIATLHNLVKNNYSDPNDRYFLYATALETSDINYTMDAAVLYGYNCPGDGAVFADQYVVPSPEPMKELVARPLPPAIRGSVYRYDNQMQPVSDAHAQLFNMSYIVDSYITGPDGRFNFELPGSKEGDAWALFVTHPGYKAKYVPVPYSLILGKKYVREDILLEPEATVTGTVINEKGEGVRVHMRMDDGAYQEFHPVCLDFLPLQGAAGTSLNNHSASLGSVQTIHNSGAIVTSGNSGKNLSAGTGSSPGSVSLSTGITSGAVSNMIINPPCTSPTQFTLYSTSGNHRIIIDPVDPGYLSDTVEVDVHKDKNDLAPITVLTKKHRILVRVKELSYSGTPAPAAPVANAKVTVENYATGITNNIGEVSFEYVSAIDTVRLYVEGPAQSDYVPTVKTAYADESAVYKVIIVTLRPGGRIRGVVYAGTTDSSSVASARVYADIPGEIKIETLSDAQGNYELRNVPLNTKIRLRAVKSVSNFVGDSLQVQVMKVKPSDTGILEGINFHLRVFNDMDISRLLGFPVEVTRLTLGGAGGKEVYISGNFTDIPSNGCFSLPVSETGMRFNNVSIIPSPYQQNENGVPLSQPKDNKVTTNKNKLSVNLYKNYKADLVGDQLLGLEVVDISKGTGAIAARVKFDEASFPTSLVSFKETVWLSSGTTGTIRMPAFSTEPGYVNYPNGLYISDANGGPLSFTFDNLNLEASRAGSVINGDTLRLNATLHTNFRNIPQPDAALQLGKMVFIKEAAQAVSFKSISGKDLVIPLSQSTVPWSLNVSNWVLGQGNGLRFVNGFVNTGIVTVPFTNIYVEQVQDSTLLKGGDYKLDQLSLANLVTLNITGQKQFGYDVGRHAWKLSVSGLPGQPCAWFGGLPGMAQGDKVEIENFFFVSSGNPVFNISQTGKPLTLYNVGLFTPGLITVINDDIAIAGMIDYKIPYMNNGNKIDYKIFYFRKNDNSIGFRNEVAAFLITPPGPVTMEFFQVTGTQTLDEKGFYAKGKVYEKIGSDRLFEFDAWLYRTTDSTSLIVDRTTNQMFRFSGSSAASPRLENVWGRTIVSGAGWRPLSFGGDLRNAKGAGGSLSFTVQGDLVADEQEITVANIPGPFSGISNFTYDFANKRFTGIIDFGRTLAGGASFNASAEVLFDQSGWYLLGLGSVAVPSPSMGGDASVFIGSYKVNQDIINKFIPNSRVYQLFGEPPANFPALNQQFSGFYIEGGVHLPIPVLPQFEFDLGLISAQLSHEIGADIRMSMNFTEANTYHMGVSIYGRITAGVGASMGVVCASSTVTGKGLISADGLYSSNGSWSATGYSEFGISGVTELGVGTCTSSCEGIFGVGPCFVDSASAGKSLFGKFTISDAGTNFEFGFK
jgi:hypothetical protein